jgi:selenide,water dikinase
VITTAIKRDMAPTDSMAAAIESMTRLNDTASAALLAADVSACTDVTGFGLLGHLHRLLRASGVAGSLDAAAVPLLTGVRELAGSGNVPGGTQRNLEAITEHVSWNGASELTRHLLSDAQTSGGLLAACPPDNLEDLLGGLHGELACAVIGRVTDGPAGTITVSGDVA